MSSVATLSPRQLDVRVGIVETAEALFRDIGYQKTTVADIAKALKMRSANVTLLSASLVMGELVAATGRRICSGGTRRAAIRGRAAPALALRKISRKSGPNTNRIGLRRHSSMRPRGL